jgi:hypothetical protein
MTQDIVELLAAVVRGDMVDAARIGRYPAAEVCREAVRQGVAPLVDDRLTGLNGVPDELRRLVRGEARREAAADVLREVDLTMLLAAMADAGLQPLLLKGAHLAYGHYERPELRPRLDSDLLIPDEARGTTHDLLLELGYESDRQVRGDLVKHQRTYLRRHAGVVVHAVDVHWKISNPQVFAAAFSYEELAARAVPLPALHPAARGLSDVDALLVACVHRVAHHADFDRLIWVHDIDLVARRIDAAGWARVVDLAVRRRIAAVCRAGLAGAAARFHTPIPADLLGDGRWSAPDPEITATYVESRGHLTMLGDNLKALPTWSARRRLVLEHLFPPADYIRHVYAPSSAAPLPLLYAWRVLRGAPAWLGQSWAEARRRRHPDFK